MATIYKYFHVGNQNLYSGDLNLQSPVLLTFSKIKNGVKGETKSHMHAHLEIFYFENGGGYLEFNSKLYPLKAHDLLVVDSKRLHCQYSDDEKVSLTYYDFAIDNLHLNGLAPNSLTLKGFMIHSFENKHNKIYENILRLLDEFNHKLYSYHSKIQAIFTEILVDIIRLSPVNNLTLSESDLRNANRTALIAAKYYIDEHYSEEINLEILTKQTFMNKSYLVTQFKKLFNDRYSWGISRILNQNSVNSEFVKWRPRVSLSPFFAFFMWDYFPLQGDITLFANITPKNNFTFS